MVVFSGCTHSVFLSFKYSAYCSGVRPKSLGSSMSCHSCASLISFRVRLFRATLFNVGLYSHIPFVHDICSCLLSMQFHFIGRGAILLGDRRVST
jgi:hypothetical protein